MFNFYKFRGRQYNLQGATRTAPLQGPKMGPCPIPPALPLITPGGMTMARVLHLQEGFRLGQGQKGEDSLVMEES